MRNTQTTLHRRLKCGAAMAAAMLALALGGPASAQGVTGTGQITTGTGTITSAPNTTTVTTTSNQSVVTWRLPMSGPTGGAVNFIPAGNSLNFQGSGDYIVLNRYVGFNPVVPGNFAFNRQVTMLGNVTSTDVTTGQRGGNIWFYNAGGFLIGSTGVFNVGSLVLTANDIDTTGGFLGPGGTIRFRGANASTAGVQIDAGASITVGRQTPGSAYMAVVAPRVVQRGVVDVDGSVAYVAAEQADITINNGLFDINVLVGAEGGNVIDHSGVTTGASPIDGDGRDSRIYMVAMPKNDAVTMLVAGQIGYRDPVTAQIEPNGAIRLAAGYNIFGGEIAQNPGSTAAANIGMSDIIVNSAIAARATNNFDAAPVFTVPTGGPAAFVPPPQLGLLRFNQNALLSGDNRSTISIRNQQALLAAGNLALVSGGRAGLPGLTQLTLSYNPALPGNRAAAQILGLLTLDSSVVVDEFAGSNATGGTARVSVNGGQLVASGIELRADAVAGYGSATQGGNAQGGTTEFIVTDAGATVNTISLSLSAEARGGGTRENMNLGITEVANTGGSGNGGIGFISVSNGAALTTTQGILVSSIGFGGTGSQQSGSATGGLARLSISGATSSIIAPFTGLFSGGRGGGTINRSPTDIVSARGGNGTGGISEIISDGAANLGATFLDASGIGGSVTAAPYIGGNGQGGATNIIVSGGTTTFNGLALAADGLAGGGRALPNIQTVHGIGIGGTAAIRAQFGGTVRVNGNADITAVGNTVAGAGINTLERTGGVVELFANSGTIDVTGTLTASVSAGFDPVVGLGEVSNQNARGGNIDVRADNGGLVSAAGYDFDATATTANATGSIGNAQGGNVFLTATNLGRILGGAVGTTINVSAIGGSGPIGGQGIGGNVRLDAGSGRIRLGAISQIVASGVSGISSSTTAGAIGRGGVIQFDVRNTGAGGGEIDVGELFALADGSTGQIIEGGTIVSGNTGGDGRGGSVIFNLSGGQISGARLDVSATGRGGPAEVGQPGGIGQGGDVTVNMTGGRLDVANVRFAANGIGGTGADGQRGGVGRGGTVNFVQTGGDVAVIDLTLEAGGTGGDGGAGGIGGTGTGGSAHLNLVGGSFLATTAGATAIGTGGLGGDALGTAGAGGTGVGGEARVTVNHANITAGLFADASAIGGRGGEGAIGGNGGEATGGLAILDINNVDAPGVGFAGTSNSIGGDGGNGTNGDGGNGGNGVAGQVQILVRGAGGNLLLTDPLIRANGTGGNGGIGQIDPTAPVPAINPAPRSGNGGNGTGGSIRFEARDGGRLNVRPGASGPFAANGLGGNGGNGSDNLSAPGLRGGNGGDAGAGFGGQINLVAAGGSLTVNGTFSTFGGAGTAGNGGAGTLTQTVPCGPNGSLTCIINVGGGSIGSQNFGSGGLVTATARDTAGGTGTLTLDAVTMDASADFGTSGNILLRDESAAGGINAINGLSLFSNGFDFGNPADGVTIEALNSDLTIDNLVVQSSTNARFIANGARKIRVGGTVNVTTAANIYFDHNNPVPSSPTILSGGNALYRSLNGSFIGGPGTMVRSDAGLTIDVAGNIAANGLSAAGATNLFAGNNINLGGTLAGTDDVALIAGNDITIANIAVSDDLVLSAGRNITIGSAEALGDADSEGDGQNIRLLAGDSIILNRAAANDDLTVNVGRNFTVGAGGVDVGGNIDVLAADTANLGRSFANGSVNAQAAQINFVDVRAGGNIDLRTAPGQPGPFGPPLGNGNVSGDNLNAGGSITIDAIGLAQAAGANAGDDMTITASAANLGVGAAGSNIRITVTSGANAGALTAGDDLVINSGGAIDVTNGRAGDDIILTGTSMTLGDLRATGTGNDAEGDGSDFTITATGNVTITRADAASDLLANTGGNFTIAPGGSITVGNDAVVRAQGNATLRTTTSGRDIFVTSDAVTSLGLTSAGRMLGVSGVRTLGSAAWSAGEDMLVHAIDEITVGNLSAGGSMRLISGDIGTTSQTATITTGNLTSTGTANDSGFIDILSVRPSRTVFFRVLAGPAATDSITLLGRSATTGVVRSRGDVDFVTLGNINVNGSVTSTAGHVELLAGQNVIVGVPASGSLTVGDVTAAQHINLGIGNSVTSIATGNINAGTYLVARTSGGNVTMGNVNVGTDLTIDSIAGTGDVVVGNVTAGDDILIQAANRLTVGNVVSTGLGDDADPAFSFIVSDQVGRAIRLRGGTSIVAGNVTSPGRVIFFSPSGSVTAQTVQAPQAIMAFARGDISFGPVTTAGHFFVGDSALYLPNFANLLDTYDPGLLATLPATRTAGGLTINGPLSAGEISIFTLNSTAISGLTQTTGRVRIDTGGNLNLGGGITGTAPITLNAGGSFNSGALSSGGNLTVNSVGDATFATVNSAGQISIQSSAGRVAATTIGATGRIDIAGFTGITVPTITSPGLVTLSSTNGAIRVDGNLTAGGGVNANGQSVFLRSVGPLSVINAIGRGGNVDIASQGNLTVDAANASGALILLSDRIATINGIATGASINLRSADINIGQNGRLGTLGTTQSLTLVNGDRAATAFVGGTGTRVGWHLDAAEITRLFSGGVTVDGGIITKPGTTALGSPNPPDVVVDDFTFNAAQQLGATGTFAITTGGKMRVIGDALFTGMVDGQSVRLRADSALEVILGQGSVVLNGAGTDPGGVLRLESDDVIVATAAAITDVAAATTTAAINDRLALNDGVLSDAGALVAKGIDVTIRNGFFVQNSGVQGAAGRDYANRRGLTFGALGLNITTGQSGNSSIVINGRHLGPTGTVTGPVTGLDAIGLITINGVTGALTGFNPASTMNGCIIVNVAACRAGPDGFPVQDPIDTVTDSSDVGLGSNILPLALITLRGLDPISGSPLIDDPVTGAGNEDMWSPDEEDEEEALPAGQPAGR